jgi:ASC-1-like (ASCH) protein
MKITKSATVAGDAREEEEAIAAIVTRVDVYGSFEEMLLQQGLARILPGMRSFAEG